MSSKGTLFIVATPIGNREDLSPRAVATLARVDRIYAEDTRHSLPLLRHYGINTPLVPLHDHNESESRESILNYLQSGADAALISDAGTPLISDPGYKLVRACQETHVQVSPIPGPSALTAALSVCGLPTDRFLFVGFPPHKSAARKRWLGELVTQTHTLVLFESPHRILACLKALVDVFGEQRQIAVCRELSKRFETVMHGKAVNVLQRVENSPNDQRGEFVVVVAGNEPDPNSGMSVAEALELDKTINLLLQHLPIKTVSVCAAELCGVTRKLAYNRALELQRE